MKKAPEPPAGLEACGDPKVAGPLLPVYAEDFSQMVGRWDYRRMRRRRLGTHHKLFPKDLIN